MARSMRNPTWGALKVQVDAGSLRARSAGFECEAEPPALTAAEAEALCPGLEWNTDWYYERALGNDWQAREEAIDALKIRGGYKIG